MPELPEVETIARDLNQAIAGQRIRNLSYYSWPKTFVGMTPQAFGESLQGLVIRNVRRRAKRVVLELSDGKLLVVSLRMTGQLVFSSTEVQPTASTRFILTLEHGALRFDDVRKFGRCWLYSPEEWENVVSRLGPEPLELKLGEFRQLVQGKKRMAKPALLDQNFLAGIGNIYADEALWKAGIHPTRRLDSLKTADIDRLYHAVREVLETGIRNRGTSIDDYIGGLGDRGTNQNFLQVYGRKGEACAACGTPIEKTVIGQRGTHFCPRCQHPPRGRSAK